jgi:hypothetical protein
MQLPDEHLRDACETDTALTSECIVLIYNPKAYEPVRKDECGTRPQKG